MYLVEAKDRVELPEEEVRDGRLASDRWQDFPFSCFSHHGEACCEVAREWLVAMDFAQLNGGDLTSGPRWMRSRWEWGPTAWPIHWCEAIDRKILDCGAHAALAHEAFAARGVTAFRAQFVQRYSQDATAQWRCKWGADSVSEPGKAMAQPSMALAMRILEIQEHEDDYVEAVVDGSIAELPMYFFYPHRMLRQCGETGALQPLGRGKTHLMGRLCMEHDIVAANVQLPEGTRAGDLLIFCDAGGYDRSMSYVFGRG